MNLYPRDKGFESWRIDNRAPGAITTENEARLRLAADGYSVITSITRHKMGGHMNARAELARYGYYGDNLLCSLRCAARLGRACAASGYRLAHPDTGARVRKAKL